MTPPDVVADECEDNILLAERMGLRVLSRDRAIRFSIVWPNGSRMDDLTEHEVELVVRALAEMWIDSEEGRCAVAEGAVRAEQMTAAQAAREVDSPPS